MLKALMICDTGSAYGRQTMLDHIGFLDHAPPGTVEVTYIDLHKKPSFDVRWLEADLAVIHTTVVCYRWHHRLAEINDRLSWLARFPGVVAALPQDEYDHSFVLDEWLSLLGTSLIVSCFGERYRALLYPRMHRRARFMFGLTGYLHEDRIAESAKNGVARRDRSIDLFYRARNLKFSFGLLGYLKGHIGETAPIALRDSGLRLDISVRAEDTLLGDSWLRTLGSSVATLGSQSGSSMLDRRGEMRLHIRALAESRPDLTFEEADELCTGALTRYSFAALGPRHLEAVMTRTVQVLVEGDYSDAFKPWVHYIPIKRDLSDLSRLPELLRDDALLERLSEQAYADFVESGRYSYGWFAAQFLREVSALRAGSN